MVHHHSHLDDRVGTRVQCGARRQGGFSIIEAMAALLIFSTGVLGIARLQSVAVQETGTAAFRSTASLLAKNLISRMWLSDRTAATLQANFQSTPTAGAGYTAWLASVTTSGLPAATATVLIAPVAGGGTAPVSSTQATVTVSWRAPGDKNIHTYTETAQIK